MCSKQSITDPPSVLFLKKNYFSVKKMLKKLDVLLINEFLWQYMYMDELDQFQKI
jgi:hypothetical protein